MIGPGFDKNENISPSHTTRPKIAISFWDIAPHPEVTRDFEKLENQFLFLQEFFLVLQCESFEAGCRKLKLWSRVGLCHSQCIWEFWIIKRRSLQRAFVAFVKLGLSQQEAERWRSWTQKQIIQCNGFQILSQLLINVSFSRISDPTIFPRPLKISFKWYFALR